MQCPNFAPLTTCPQGLCYCISLGQRMWDELSDMDWTQPHLLSSFNFWPVSSLADSSLFKSCVEEWSTSLQFSKISIVTRPLCTLRLPLIFLLSVCQCPVPSKQKTNYLPRQFSWALPLRAAVCCQIFLRNDLLSKTSYLWNSYRAFQGQGYLEV